MRRTLLAIVALSLAVSGCAGSGGHKAAPTSVARPVGPNPDVVPAVITPAYVDAVFVELNRIYGDATRLEIGTDSVSTEVYQLLRSIYTDPDYGFQVKIFKQSLADGFANVVKPPGDRTTKVLKLLSATPSCILVQTETTFRGVVLHPGPPAASEYYMLGLKPPNYDPNHINPTPWAISINVSFTTPTTVALSCQ